MSGKQQAVLPPAGLPIRMIRSDLKNIPQCPFPSGYVMRAMGQDEGPLWEQVWRESEPFDKIPPGLFVSQFGTDAAAIALRCFFLVTPEDSIAGTISGWQATLRDGKLYGQIHWVAVHPDHRGRGLCKPLMTHTMNFLSTRHDRCFLDTATRRLPAIKVYLDFGFLPDMTHPEAERAWALVREELRHPALGHG